MIVVTVDLVSAISRTRDCRLAQLHISNVGGTETLGDYEVKTFGQNGGAGKTGRVERYPRKAVGILNLVRRAIEAAGYTK